MKRLDVDTFPLTGRHLIEASAGTGKTYTITNLYLRLLLGRDPALEGPRTVDQILVLTFTIAATEELRARIRGRINEARTAFADGGSNDPLLERLVAGSEDRDRDRKLLTGAVQLMDEASIFTIHSFCARVLADNAFETTTLFDQSLDADRDELLEHAAQDCFRADLLTLPKLARRTALDLWPSPGALAAAVKPFLFRGRLELTPPERPVDFDDYYNKVREAKRRWVEESFEQAIRDSRFNGGSNVVKKLGEMTTFCRSDELDTDLWQYWSTNELQRISLNKDGVYPTHPLIELIDDIWAAHQQVEVDLWHLVARRMRHYLERYKEEQAQLTLDDLLVRVRDALQAPGGAALARSLRARWPIAMIDEFQDTDDIQWDIFSDIYAHGADALYLIGDPKQAIYQFRGADVYTYINAKRAIESHWSLDTNWRSTAPMVEAVNALFDRPDVFGNDGDIPFVPAQPSPKASRMAMRDSDIEVPPVSLIQFDAGNQGGRARSRRLAMGWAAEETVRLLKGGREGGITVDGEPLHAGQIAMLVRSGIDARAARDALTERGVQSVFVTLESVFLTNTADDLRLILQAALEPTNESAIRAALATPLMQTTASEIDALSHDMSALQNVLAEFADYHRLWAELDVATMIQRLLERRAVPQKWFAHPGGERQMTNLRHLTELLQTRAAVAPGMHRLLKWFTREKQAATTVAADERQLRLESDRDLVKIVTMHAAKGLEYEVVMIPMAAFSPPDRDKTSLIHESRQGAFEAVLNVDGNEQAKGLARSENLAEETRLLYVALTRAKYRCYIGIPRDMGGQDKATSKSAIAQLLDIAMVAGEDWTAQVARRLPDSLFDVRSIERVESTAWQATRDTSQLRAPPPVPVTNRRNWRIHSYTGVSRMIEPGQTDAVGSDRPGFGDDDPDVATAATGTRTRLTFPRGPRVGIALHTLLEHLDFTTSLETQLPLFEQCLDRVGLVDERSAWQQVLLDWVNDVLTTRMFDVCLTDLPRAQRLDELEFHFPLAAGDEALDIARDAGYCRTAGRLDRRLAGLMTGMIDLVFEADSRFYLVDYKSNHLGPRPEDYATEHLGQAIRHHGYDLQYLIYTVALDRFLASRIADYDYEKHFGGVAYLFLRGMAGAGESHGVFVDRPEQTVIRDLGDALTGTVA